MTKHSNDQFGVGFPAARRLLTLAFIAACALTQEGSLRAQFPLPFYEPFPASYTNTSDETVQVPAGGATVPGRRLGNGNTTAVWSFGGAPGGGSSVVVGPAALSYLNLATNPEPTAGLYIRTNNTTANRNRGMLFATTTSGSIYSSFLVKVEQAPTEGQNRLFAKLDTATTGNAQSTSGVGVWVTSENTLAISKNSNSSPTADTGVSLGTDTHLVVIRYTWNPEADDDEVAVWVDPTVLAVDENNVPTPTLTFTSGGDIESLSSFFIYHVNTEVTAGLFVDEIRVGTSWANVTPTGVVCDPAIIVSSPTNQTLVEGLSATLSVLASGTTPSYSWQVSTDSGSSWSDIIGADTATFLTPVLGVDDNGVSYRALLVAACGGSSVTSDVATITVEAAVGTPNGLVVSDEFTDGSRSDFPYSTNNSIWFATAGLDTFGAGLVGTSQTGSAVWTGFFTDDQTAPPGLPVHLEVGQQIKATLAFSAANIVTNGGNSLRLGLFDYADGGTRPTTDGSIVANSGLNVRGYMMVINFGTTFDVNTPITIYARNNLGAADLMGTTGNYESYGSGPTDATLSGTSSFTSDTTNLVELSVTRTAEDTVQITASVTNAEGAGWSHTVTDSTYAYPRFDAFSIRPNSQATTADQFTFHLFKVEVAEVSVPVAPFNITDIQMLSSTSAKLTWESVNGKSYQVQSTPALSPITWSTNATVIASGTSTSYTNSPVSGDQQFFRVVALP